MAVIKWNRRQIPHYLTEMETQLRKGVLEGFYRGSKEHGTTKIHVTQLLKVEHHCPETRDIGSKLLSDLHVG